MEIPSMLPRLDLLRRAARDIGRDAGCRLIILFGSGARATSRPPEDVDVGVLADRLVDPVALTNSFIRALGFQHVDVTDLSRADPLLLVTAAREGVALYEAQPGELARFASLAARRFADTRKFREAERREIQDFLARRRPGA